MTQSGSTVTPRDLDELCDLVAEAAELCRPLRATGARVSGLHSDGNPTTDGASTASDANSDLANPEPSPDLAFEPEFELGGVEMKEGDARSSSAPSRGSKSPLPEERPSPKTTVSLAEFNQHFDHDAGDLVLSCGSGWSLDELDEKLQAAGQRLPFEFPRGLGFSVGGVVAAGCEGYTAPWLGRLRDSVLGLGYVDGRGRPSRCGGRVVKNVTGFDLTRLHVGAQGRFGILHEVTLRLRPRPEREATFVFPVDDLESGFELASGLRKIRAPISGMLLISGSVLTASESDWLAAVRVEGRSSTMEAAREWLATAPPFEELNPSEARGFWSSLGTWAWRQPNRLFVDGHPAELASVAAHFARPRLGAGRSLLVETGGTRLTLTWPDPESAVETETAGAGSKESGQSKSSVLPTDLNLPKLLDRHRCRITSPSSDLVLPHRPMGAAKRELRQRVINALDPAGVFGPKAPSGAPAR